MENKTCGDCKHYIAEMYHCEKFDCYAGESEFCDEFEPAKKQTTTNGDRIRQMSKTVFAIITASPEVLAESSVYFEEEYTLALEGSEYGVTFPGGWTSPFIEYTYGTKEEAIAATVARLKEVEE